MTFDVKNILAASVAAGLLFMSGLVSALPLISFQLPPNELNPGDAISVQLVGVELVDLYGYQFSIHFNPNVLAVQSVTEGLFLSQAGTTFFVPGEVNNTSGEVAFIGNTLIGPIQGASGNGVLASISFQTLAIGGSELSLGDMLFLDANLNSMLISGSGGSVRVGGTSHLPEPNELSLLGIAILALQLSRKRHMNGRKNTLNHV